MKDSVRIVLVGDPKVGKTSIIEVLITEKFQEDVQPVLPVLVVPKDVTPEHVLVSIVDTPGDPEESDKVDTELKQGDVVVLVYAVDDQTSTERVLSHWLPKLRGMSLKVPIILVGNKIDTRGGVSDPQAAANMEAFIKPIMDKFREVDVCIECSAKTVQNISEVFYFAQKAVLYPTGQVYDVENHILKPKAAAALRRIFKLCDRDEDGGLNDKELNDFQHTCFSVHLQQAELEGVKKVVKESKPQTGLNEDGSLSVEGFIFLHTLFVQKGRLETTWIVLRKFGYDDDMRLHVDASQMPKVGEGQSVELSAKGKDFLIKTFRAADKNGEGLSMKELEKTVFGGHPDGAFASRKTVGPRLTRTQLKGEDGTMTERIDEAAFLARWAMYVHDSVEDALLSLTYMGFNERVGGAVKVTKSRRRDRSARSVSRDVVKVGVLGGDTTVSADVVRGLVDVAAGGVSEDVMAGRIVSDGDVVEKMVVLRSVSGTEEESGIGDKTWMEGFDVMCITMDASSEASVDRALSTWEAIESEKAIVKVPVVFVASVDGEDGVEENLSRVDEFCVGLKIPTPTRVCISDGDFGRLYDDLLGVALYPQVACPDYYAGGDGGGASAGAATVKIVIGAVALGAMAYGAKRLYDYYVAKPSGGATAG